jgi:hypothetical protein
LHRLDQYGAAMFRALDGEFHRTVGKCEQGVILADTDVLTGMELGAALTDEDVARRDELAAIAFDAEAFRFGIAAVARTAACFLVCHCR